MKQGWEKKKLEDISEKIMAGGDKPRVFSETVSDECKVPVYANGVQNKGLCGYTNKATIHDESITISARGTIGFCCVRNEPFVPIVRLITIIPKKNVNIHYLNYVMNNLSIENNGVAIPQLTVPMLKGITIPIPPLPEQECIVAELDCLSSIIEKQKEQLNELDNLAQSTFYTMFGDPDNSKYPKVPLCLLSKSKLSYGSGASAVEYDNNIRYIRITDIQENGKLDNTPMSPSIYDEKYLLNDGDILFARSGATVGKTYLYTQRDGTAIYAGYLIRFVPNKEIVIPEYVFYFTRSEYYKAFIEKNAQAVAQPNINAKQYGDLMVCVPPLSLQQEFASKIKMIEKQKELIKQSIAETETLFNSRMDYYFN